MGIIAGGSHVPVTRSRLEAGWVVARIRGQRLQVKGNKLIQTMAKGQL